MTWSILLQQEGKKEVCCKHVKFFPVEQADGSVTFGKLANAIFRVIVTDGEKEIKIQYSQGEYNIRHPDVMEYPFITVGEGSKRLTFRDKLSKKVLVQGDYERGLNEAEFYDRLRRFIGGQLAADVIMEIKARFERAVATKIKSKPKTMVEVFMGLPKEQQLIMLEKLKSML